MLLSGGLDSATCLAIAKAGDFQPFALTVRYGQRHEAEVAAARLIATETGRNFERIGQSVLKLSADHEEGAKAFVEKRKPVFKGR